MHVLLKNLGTFGWERGIMYKKDRIKKRTEISRNELTKYRLADRGTFNPILYGEKLFQQWCVDQYTRIESDRIWYIKVIKN